MDEPVTPWTDARVQQVYELLCDDADVPTGNQHWEGWVARRIVDALCLQPEQASRYHIDIIHSQRRKHQAQQAHILDLQRALTHRNARIAALGEAIRAVQHQCRPGRGVPAELHAAITAASDVASQLPTTPPADEAGT